MTDAHFPPLSDAERIAGWPVVDEMGDRIGVIEALYGDEHDDIVEWAMVDSGLFQTRHLLPLADAMVLENVVQVGYERKRVLQAPMIDRDTDLDAETEAALHRHYGLPWEDEPAGEGHAPRGPAADGAHRLRSVRRPSLLRRFLYS